MVQQWVHNGCQKIHLISTFNIVKLSSGLLIIAWCLNNRSPVERERESGPELQNLVMPQSNKRHIFVGPELMGTVPQTVTDMP
jgi:hypothetical protein